MNKDSMIFIDNSSESEYDNEYDCILCEKKINTHNFPKIILKALERKYCSNLNNYFFIKTITKILIGEK